MEAKTYKINLFGESHEVVIKYSSYTNNGTLAVQLYDNDEPYGTVTVNLEDSILLPDNMQCVDENNLPGIGKWLKKNKLAKPAGFSYRSGFCEYPVYEFLNVPEIACEDEDDDEDF